MTATKRLPRKALALPAPTAGVALCPPEPAEPPPAACPERSHPLYPLLVQCMQDARARWRLPEVRGQAEAVGLSRERWYCTAYAREELKRRAAILGVGEHLPTLVWSDLDTAYADAGGVDGPN